MVGSFANEVTRLQSRQGSAQTICLRFRLLPAEPGEIEAAEQTASSPVCGWLIFNLLDKSLCVHSTKGEFLGYLDTLNRWQPPPGTNDAVIPHGVDLPLSLFRNPHLHKLIQWLHDKSPDVFNFFFRLSIASFSTAIQKT